MGKKSRPTFNDYIFGVCKAVAARSTCRHRDQGAVIVRDKAILSTGYNGAPRDAQDCLEKGFCSKAEGKSCRAEGLHGESNAIISAAKRGVSIDGAIIYCTYSPCRACCNMIKNAGISMVLFLEVYDGFPQGPAHMARLGVDTRRVILGEGNDK